MLQWGHRLSAMETSVWGHRLSAMETGVGPIAIVLQWGHRLSAMETHTRRASMGPPPFASMGPPPFGDGNQPVPNRRRVCTCFNGATAFRRWKPWNSAILTARNLTDSASMGPPPFGDGNIGL